MTNLIEAYEKRIRVDFLSLYFIIVIFFSGLQLSARFKTFYYCIEPKKDMQARYTAHYVNKILIRLKAEQYNSNFRRGEKLNLLLHI